MKNINTEVLAIGDELVTGSIINTNSAYIANKCEVVGLSVTRHSCFGDDLAVLTAAILEASERSRIVVVTGGLGPTFDDLTRDAAAQAAGVELLVFSSALLAIEEFFRKLGRPMPESNKRQACFPKNAEIMDNPIGTAPGFVLKIGLAHFFFIPGVPREMQKMLDEQVIPRILQMFHNELPVTGIKTIDTFGISEALIGERLEAVAQLMPTVKLGTRAIFPIIQVKIYVRDLDQVAVDKALDNAAKLITEQLAAWIISYNNTSIEDIISSLLRQHESSIAIIENGSGGLLTEWINNVPNNSDFFRGSEVLSPTKPIGAESTRLLATQIRKRSSATYGIAISGVLNQEAEGLLGEPFGKVFIAIADLKQVHGFTFHVPFGNQNRQKKMYAMLVLDSLRRKLIGVDPLSEIFGKYVEVNNGYIHKTKN
jgi:nicotinamide-nucleotide amidase